MPREGIKVELLRHTPDPERAVAMAARICYSASDLNKLKDRIDNMQTEDFVRRLMGMGHVSTIEHVSFTFGIEGVSRAFLAQVTRHRIASFSVQSQRYVSQKGGFGYIVPPSIEALGPQAVERFAAQMGEMSAWYDEWLKQLGKDKAEDARFVLPNAAVTRMLLTMNARELLHFFNQRLCMRAQWEIREVALQMLKLVKPVSPVIFEKAGPLCISGPCPEGEYSCGQFEQVRERYTL